MKAEPDSTGIEARDITVMYGGHVAVSGVTLTAPQGRITGLIGPNGAGKTTLFNACSGLLRPTLGSILLFGKDVTRWDAAKRPRLGLGRTFQKVELCNAMTVRANVELGAEARMVGPNLIRQVVSTRAQRNAVTAAAAAALEECGLGPLADRRTSTLSTGQRRLVELARAFAGGFRMLLLDEPSSGLDVEETATFGDIVSRAVETRNLGVLLVEHDMSLVMAICEHLYVLDFGNLLFGGSPVETQSSSIVRAAYLGESVEEVA